MLANQILSSQYPTVNLTDKVSLALQFMDDFDVQHLPVIAEDKFLGLVSKDDLLDADETGPVEAIQQDLIKKSIRGGEHFISALKLASANSLSLVPVINETMELLGAIPENELIKAATIFTGAEEPGAVIVLEMERKAYSFGEISRLVETNDAFITQFNTTTEAETGLMIVTLKISKMEVSDIVATFQRYDYNVRYYIGEEQYENEIRYNYNHLMSYLKM